MRRGLRCNGCFIHNKVMRTKGRARKKANKLGFDEKPEFWVPLKDSEKQK